MREYVAVVKTLLPILQRGKSLDASWDEEATSLAKQITFGVLRDYFRLEAIVAKLVARPLAGKHLDIHLLLLAGLYSIDNIRRPDYASVNDTVETATLLGKPWAKGMVNGVLRNYLRRRQEIIESLAPDAAAMSNHPAWLQQEIERAWPDDAGRILAVGNAQGPMTLRVNAARTTTAGYRRILADAGIESREGTLSPQALYLGSPVAIDDVPGFDDGLASVQDEASQLAAMLADVRSGQRVLDACAAPGGKTCHLLELHPDIDMTAVDIDADRARQIRQNLSRLELECRVVVTDLRKFDEASRFDRILLDAPCSATGIIRRHPDIKLLRRESDIAKLVVAQLDLLAAAWRLLTAGGVLVYSTCSILPAENEAVVAKFLEQHDDAAPYPIDADWGVAAGSGRQLFPEIDGPDGFYYARLVKGS